LTVLVQTPAHHIARDRDRAGMVQVRRHLFRRDRRQVNISWRRPFDVAVVSELVDVIGTPALDVTIPRDAATVNGPSGNLRNADCSGRLAEHSNQESGNGRE